MRHTVVGILGSEELALGAAQLLHDAGHRRRELALLSDREVHERRLRTMVRHLRIEHLPERDGIPLRQALVGALIGSLVVEVPVLAWLFLGLGQDTAAGLGMNLVALRALIASAAWKFGAVLGGYIGLFLGSDQGLDRDLVRPYEEYLHQGNLVLVARVAPQDVPEARGILIESAALAIGDPASSDLPEANRA